MKALSLVLAISIAFAPACATTKFNAGEEGKLKVAIIKKGSKTPFDGVLYSNEAYADQKVKHSKALEQAENRRKRDLDLQKNRLSTAAATAAISLEACNVEKTMVYNIKDNHIKFLDDQLVKAGERGRGSAWWENALWFGLGAAAVIAGGWAIGQASEK